MLSSACSHSLIQRPSLPPSLPRIRAPSLARPASSSPITRSFRSFDSHSRQFKLVSFEKREWRSSLGEFTFDRNDSNRTGRTFKWRISCFRREDFSSEASKPEAFEQSSREESVKPEVEKPTNVKKDWTFVLRKVADFVFRAIGTRWTVPWTAETIVQVMLLWIGAFWFIGSWMVPFAAHIAGFSRDSLTFRGQALFSLVTDVAEGLAGIAILHRCLSRFFPLPNDWFKFSLKGNWQFDVALGCLMFPLVNRLSQFNLDLLPLLPSTPVTLSSVEQSIMARDPVAMALYAIVVSICAPVWEEIVFRGFLLPSLTKYMPVWCAILMSSIAFALAHFNVQRMLPLIFLGVVMGVIFARSRNLLPSILLHSLWNGFVFLDLMK